MILANVLHSLGGLILMFDLSISVLQAAETPSSQGGMMSTHTDHAMKMDMMHHGKMSAAEHIRHRTMMKSTKYTVTEKQYHVPAVTLIDQSGQSVELAKRLQADRPLALNFIFTTCTTICPVMTATFSRVRKELGADSDRLDMVSISIDPEYDRPEVMQAYAEKFHADPQHWTFLTGEAEAIHQVLEEFRALFGSKMSHKPITLLKKPGETEWIRIDGLARARDLTKEIRTRLLN